MREIPGFAVASGAGKPISPGYNFPLSQPVKKDFASQKNELDFRKYVPYLFAALNFFIDANRLFY
ncbi:MAG: hypothetical protein R3C41_07710 [Calditrichia bacterium]|nr:hypothetical protein [Calditrichia bacterium]